MFFSKYMANPNSFIIAKAEREREREREREEKQSTPIIE
jgi:hypothetical protein